VAESLKHRLADIEAAGSVQDLVAGHPRRCKTSAGYVISLGDGICLKFTANHIKNPVERDGNVDWSQVSRIQITEIGRCNG
jgi:hypothetical protein